MCLLLEGDTQLVKFSGDELAVDWKTPHIPDTMGRMDMETSHVMDSLRSVAMFQAGLNVKEQTAAVNVDNLTLFTVTARDSSGTSETCYHLVTLSHWTLFNLHLVVVKVICINSTILDLKRLREVSWLSYLRD